MKRSLRGSGSVALLVALGIYPVVGHGQQTPEQIYQQLKQNQGVTTLQSDVRLVVLDVVVADAQGHPVTGLKASDFTLLEDGQQQTVKHFEEHVPPDAAAAAKSLAALHQQLPPNTFTNYTAIPESSSATVILLDALDTNVQGQMYARSQMIDYLKTAAAGEPIAIFQLGTEGMKLVQGFSSDPQVLLRAAQSGKRDGVVNPVLLSAGGARGPVEQPYERLRQQYLETGIQGLGRYLAAFPGRKNLIWFTGRVPYYRWGGGIGDPFPDTTSFIDDFQSTTDVLTLSRVAVYPVDARGLQTDPAYSAANGGIPSIHSASNFGTRQFFEHGPLDDVAKATGGRAFYNTNGIKQVIAEVADIGSHYYTFSYTPTNTVWNGSYRKLEVQMAQKGLHLEYRPGYYARGNQRAIRQHQRAAVSSPNAVPRPLPVVGTAPNSKSPTPLMLATMSLGALTPTQIVFAAQVSPDPEVKKDLKLPPPAKDQPQRENFWKSGYRTYAVRFMVRGPDLQMMPEPDLSSYHGRVELVAVLYDQKGAEVSSRDATVPININPSDYQRILHEGMVVQVAVPVPAKGNYFLRLGVHDLDTDRVGALEIPVDQIVMPKK